jgi:Xaa-Pro aminopeptidase
MQAMTTQRILEKQATAAYENGLQAIVTISPENVAYTAGFPVPSQHIPIRQRFFACVVTAKGDSAMLVADMEESQARSDSRITNIRSYNEWVEDPIEILAEMLHERGVHGGKIGIELDFLPAEYRPRLEDALPQVVFVNCEDLMGKLRIVKTPEEIEKLRRVGRAAENAHYAAAPPSPLCARCSLAIWSVLISMQLSEAISQTWPVRWSLESPMMIKRLPGTH